MKTTLTLLLALTLLTCLAACEKNTPEQSPQDANTATPSTPPVPPSAPPPSVGPAEPEPTTPEPTPVTTVTPAPATQPEPVDDDTPPATQPQPPAVSPEAMAILKDLEAAGETYKALKADVKYVVENRLTGDVETRTGWVAFQQASDTQPARFRVSFETLALGNGRPTKQQVDYIFDGQWLKVAKHNIKSLTHYQVAAEGERVEPLRIGKGPFPVPFGQKADEVTRLLDVEVKDPDKDAPEGSDYLLLAPRRVHRGDVNFNELELWVDRKTHLPAQVRSRDESHNITTVTFTDIQTQAEMKPEWFTFEKPAGWSLQIERLK